MADDRDGPSVDRVREQLHRNEPPEPDFDPTEGPDPERVAEQLDDERPPD